VRELNLVHLKKTLLGRVVTSAGITIDVRLEQLLKAPVPIEVTLLGIVKVLSAEQN
jgi:hypothetical protein